jgi:hypothetical protein
MFTWPTIFLVSPQNTGARVEDTVRLKNIAPYTPSISNTKHYFFEEYERSVLL